MRQVHLLALAVVAGASASLWAAPTRAEAPLVVTGSHEDRTSMRVPFADLVLASPAGQRELRNRVRSAAFQVCCDSDYLIHYCASATFQAAKPQMALATAQQQRGELAAATSVIRVALR
jgi:UrcA family protein